MSPGDHHACSQPFKVPFPRSRKGLVEVVEIEDLITLGGWRSCQSSAGERRRMPERLTLSSECVPSPRPSLPLNRAGTRTPIAPCARGEQATVPVVAPCPNQGPLRLDRCGLWVPSILTSARVGHAHAGRALPLAGPRVRANHFYPGAGYESCPACPRVSALLSFSSFPTGDFNLKVSAFYRY